MPSVSISRYTCFSCSYDLCVNCINKRMCDLAAIDAASTALNAVAAQQQMQMVAQTTTVNMPSEEEAEDKPGKESSPPPRRRQSEPNRLLTVELNPAIDAFSSDGDSVILNVEMPPSYEDACKV